MLSFFPLNILDEIWDVIESVSQGFLTYSLLNYIMDKLFYVCSELSINCGGPADKNIIL